MLFTHVKNASNFSTLVKISDDAFCSRRARRPVLRRFTLSLLPTFFAHLVIFAKDVCKRLGVTDYTHTHTHTHTVRYTRTLLRIRLHTLVAVKTE